MAIKRNITEKWLFIAAVMLMAPLIFSIFLFHSVQPVHGPHTEAIDQKLSVKNWMSREFQRSADVYFETHNGLYDVLVRTYNQIDYWAFKKAHARAVIVGEKEYLYESGYIDSYQGKDLVEIQSVRSKLKMLKKLQIEMFKEGKIILPVIAPGKASFFPEFFPTRYRRRKQSLNNYDLYVNELKNSGIGFIDFRKHFLQWRNNSQFPLYPKNGIHWSTYSSIVCFDSILGYLSESLHRQIPRIVFDKVTWSEEEKYPDNDVSEGLNLWLSPTAQRLAYPAYHVEANEGKKLSLLTIADSFWWNIFSTGLPSSCFSENYFWYYNEEIYPGSETSQLRVRDINYYEKIRRADVIIVLYNESNLNRFSDGFIQMAYKTYCEKDSASEKLQQMKGSIRNSADWYKQIQLKAAAQKINTDSMLTLDAIYMLQLNKKSR